MPKPTMTAAINSVRSKKGCRATESLCRLPAIVPMSCGTMMMMWPHLGPAWQTHISAARGRGAHGNHTARQLTKSKDAKLVVTVEASALHLVHTHQLMKCVKANDPAENLKGQPRSDAAG